MKHMDKPSKDRPEFPKEERTTEREFFNDFFNTTVPSRAWSVFEGGFPCYRGQRRLMLTTPTQRGFLFQRPTKVGSTTMVSVVLRLAHNRSPWMGETMDHDMNQKMRRMIWNHHMNQNRSSPMINITLIDKTENFQDLKSLNSVKCVHRSMHGSALGLEYDKRDPRKSFLFSLVRDPTKRAISEFFHFAVSMQQVEPTDANFRRFLNMPHLEHKYLYDLMVKNYTPNEGRARQEYLHTHNLTNFAQLQKKFRQSQGQQQQQQGRGVMPRPKEFVQHMKLGSTSIPTVVEDILDGYNFIAITERMDESLIVLQMLLNLTTHDILYTRARSSQTFSNGPARDRPCIYIQPSFLTPSMQQFFDSPEWKHTIRGDLLLYQAANASLDRTIEALGTEEFEAKLQALRTGLKLAEEHCKGRIVNQCSAGGERTPFTNTTCYIWGEGCDHDCLNDLKLP